MCIFIFLKNKKKNIYIIKKKYNSSTSLDRYFTLSIRESATFDSISAIFKFSTWEKNQNYFVLINSV